MADKPPDKKPPSDSKDAIGGCKEKTYSVSRAYKFNVSPPRIRVSDGPDCECMLCERRRERDQRNRARLRNESLSTSTSPTLQRRCEHETRDLRRSLLDSVARDSSELIQSDTKCQSCPDLIRVSQTDTGTVNSPAAVPGDDMEEYFNANRHMLDNANTETKDDDTGQKQAPVPVETHTYHFPPEVMCRANNGADNTDCDNEGHR